MEVNLSLPLLHPGQVDIWKDGVRLNAVRCGRRWGKTVELVVLACDAAAKGKKVGIFTPEYKQLQEPYEAVLNILLPLKRRASKMEGVIRLINGGLIDFWTLTDNELAGRGREYDLVLMDEAAFTKTPQMNDIWDKSIKPTMLTRKNSEAWVFSTPKGIDQQNFFWRCCNEPTLGFKEHYAPTSANPYVPPEDLERERLTNPPLVFQQEYLAQFIDWSGEEFFKREWLLKDGEPVDYPSGCETVFATIDSASKTGNANDGTAVVLWALLNAGGESSLVILDWDIVQIEGALLEEWLPSIFRRLEALGKECLARYGIQGGVWIEDKDSGTILLQQASRRGWPAVPIESRLTALGKDERAINASPMVYQGKVLMSRYAFEKVTIYKGISQNHLLSQIRNFRVGDKDAAKRADDLLDAFTYGVEIGLGIRNQDGDVYGRR